MPLDVEQYLRAIEHHTRGLAAAAEVDLRAQVEHCPDWSVADLVHHLTEVHTFWEHVARTRPLTEPTQVPEVPRAEDADLVPGMLAAMERLVATLRAAEQDAACWTWGLEENVGFITRHQVQEAAVHHWDAANAAGSALPYDFVEELVAVDAVDEFLTHSVANARWPMPAAQPLGGPLEICGCVENSGVEVGWRIADGSLGTLAFEHVPLGTGAWHASPADVLLWLYRRRPSTMSHLPADDDPLVRRFRAFTNTD